ncbi:OsmC family protein [Pseudomonas stutzeri]|nr:OsmC family protein [Stutzerimonas stutzeri]
MNSQATAMQQTQQVNGVDVGALFDTIKAVKQDPGLAEFQFRASNRWIDGGLNRSTIQAFHGCRQEDSSRSQPFILDADEPPVLLGQDRGANPVEYVLHALAACLTTTMVYHAAARGIVIRGVESRLEGDLDLRGFLGLDPSVRKGYRTVRVHMCVDSDASPATLRELAQFSPVYDIVSNSLPVEVRVETLQNTPEA